MKKLTMQVSEQHTRRQLRRFAQLPALLVEAPEPPPVPPQLSRRDPVLAQAPTAERKEQFRRSGHVTMPCLLEAEEVRLLNDRLEALHSWVQAAGPPRRASP